MEKIICLIIWMFFILGGIFAQSPKVEQTIEDLLESINSESQEDIDYQEILDDLTFLGQHPMPINRASKEDFQRLHFISDIQIDALIDFRTKTGQIYSIYEISVI